MGGSLKGGQPVIKYEHKRRDKHCVMGALNSEQSGYFLLLQVFIKENRNFNADNFNEAEKIAQSCPMITSVKVYEVRSH
ncbi:MAG TPA: hypothetical protein VN316_02570 [candidate division Zixibacteria bacterium]|nr:hypothetical protein [candidate division Zixibacteria bacterium]